jgi:ATP-dependent DNA ligase
MGLRLPDPMLSRSGPLPSGARWSFELKWDGFRAIVSTEDGLRVRSRRGWNMTPVLPELRKLPTRPRGGSTASSSPGLKREPHFPLVRASVAKRRASRYRPGDRSWIKLNNPNYWRLDLEREAVTRSRERRAGRRSPTPRCAKMVSGR